MQELALTLSKYGPGVVYGTDTVQSLIDNLVKVDYAALLRAFPTLVNSSSESRHFENDEFLELDQFRELLLKNMQFFLVNNPINYPSVIQEAIPIIEAPIIVISNIFIPIIEKITSSRQEPLSRAIDQISNILHTMTHHQKWDLPDIMNRVLVWMSSILSQQICSIDIGTKIIKLWVKIIETTQRTEYIMRLALSWFKGPVQRIDFDIIPLLQQIFSCIKRKSFDSYEVISSNSLYLHEIMQFDAQKPSCLKEMRQRRIAASRGFLYVAEPTTGLTKFGTGHFGTVLASNERSSSACINCDAYSLCTCNGHLLLSYQGQANGVIDVISIESLERIGELESDFALPQGPFTASGNNLYIISKSILYTFRKSGMKVYLVSTIGLKRPEIEFFPVPLPREYEKYVSLITDGNVIGIVFPSYLIGNSPKPQYHQYSLLTGEIMQIDSNLLDSLSSMYLAVDLDANTIIEAPFWEPVRVSLLSPAYMLSSQFLESNVQRSENIPLSLLNAVLPLFASRVSLSINDHGQPYSVQSHSLLIELIMIATTDHRYLDFVDTVVAYLAIYYYQNRGSSISDITFLKTILSLQNVSFNSRILYMKSFIRGFDHTISMSTSEALSIIDLLSPEEISSVFESGFNDIFGFLLAILYDPKMKILKYLEKTVSNEYPFVNAMTYSLLRGIIVKQTINCSAAVPLFECIKEANTYILPTLLAPILPLLHQMLEYDAIVSALISPLSTILASLEGLCSSEHLSKYSKKHCALRSQNRFNETTVIEESPHPYDNNMDYIKTLSFPGAVRVSITFDKQTETEPGCDYLQIFTDPEMKEPLTTKLSGKFESWTSPVISNSQSLTFYFHSDASLSSYGYKAYITVRSLGTTLLFKSPQIFYDLSRTIFLALLNVTKRLYSPPDGFVPIIFSFPPNLDTYTYTHQQSIELINLIGEKFGLDSFSQDYTLLFNPSSSFPISYSYLKHIIESVDPEVYWNVDYLINFASMHPMVAEAQYQDQNSLFSKIGALLMQNTLGLPDDMYQFLFNALKDSKAGRSFALLSFKAAGELCAANSPTFEIVLQAATKIQIGLSIVGPTIINEIPGVVQNFLKAFSSIIIPVSAPSILRLSDKINSIFKEIAAAVDENSAFFNCVTENLASINPTPPDCISPFVLFALCIADSLDTKKANKTFILIVVLRSLLFCIPQSIALLQSIIRKFSFSASLEENPEIFGILESIGKCFSFNIYTSPLHELFDIGPSYSMARAKIVRELLDHSKLNQLSTVINRNDDSTLGALLVLSARTFPPHTHMAVRMKHDKSIAYILSMDYVEYRFRSLSGLTFSIPAIDVSSFEYSPLPFEPILPLAFEQSSQELTDSVLSISNGVYNIHALAALSEITCKKPLDISIAKMYKFYDINNDESDKRTKFELVQFKECSIFLCNRSVPSFSFKVSSNIVFGYCSSSIRSVFHSFKISINQEKMLFLPHVLNYPLLKLESDTITIGYFGKFKQLFIQSGKLFLMPPVFLSIFESPTPFIISTHEPNGVSFNPSSPTFLLKTLLPISSVFTHVVANNTLISLCSNKIRFNGVTPNLIHFLPQISNRTSFTYFEFLARAESVVVSVHPETVRAVSLYSFSLTSISDVSSYGLFVDCSRGVCFITINGKIELSSFNSVDIYTSFTVTLLFKGAEQVSVNPGHSPFSFNINDGKSVHSSNHFFISHLDELSIPFSYDQVFKGTYPFDLSSVNGESQKVFNAQLERPCILTAPDLDQKLYQRTGVFTPLVDIDKINVKLFNYKNQTWMSMDLPRSSAYSIPDSNHCENVYATHERLQRSLKPFLSHNLYFPPNELAAKNGSLLTPFKQQAFIKERLNRFNATINMNSVIPLLSTIQESELFNLVFLISTVLGDEDLSGECISALCPLYQKVYSEKTNLFLRLVDFAMIIFEKEYVFEPIMLSNSHLATFVEIDRPYADAIYIRCQNSSFSLPLTIHSSSVKFSSFIEKESDISQITLPGDMVLIESIESNQLAFFDIYPIHFSSINQNEPFRLSLQLISFIVHNCKEYNFYELLHKRIILPIFKRLMARKPVFFGTVIAEWFMIIIYNNLIPENLNDIYIPYISLNTLRDIKDGPLCAALSLFILYLYIKTNDKSITRNRLVSLLDPFFLFEGKSNISKHIFNKLAFELLSPLPTKQIFPFLDDFAAPFLSKFAYESYIQSQKAEKVVHIEPNTDIHQIQYQSFVFEEPSLICIHFSSFENSLQVKVDDIPVNHGDVLKVKECFEVSVQRSEESKNIIVSITKQKHLMPPSMKDLITIIQLYKELQNKWTLQYESLATAIALSIISTSSLFPYTDFFFETCFPEVSPMASRLRVSTILVFSMASCSFDFPQTSHMSHFSRFLAPNFCFSNPNSKKQMVRGYVPLSTVSLSLFYYSTINHFSALSCFPGSPLIHYVDLLNIKDPTTMLRVVRTAKNDLFEAPVFVENAAYLPKYGAVTIEEINAFQGFGYHMAMNAMYGRSLPIPVSRCVIRYAFGGKIIADDLYDIDPEFVSSNPTPEMILEKISFILPQLEAIKCGVFMAHEGRNIFDANNPVFPMVLQLMPLTVPKCTENVACQKTSIPLLREKMFDIKVSLMTPEEKHEAIDSIIESLKHISCFI